MVDVVWLLLLEFAWRFALTPLGTPVLEPNLNAGLAQLQAQSKFLTSKDIRIGRSFESPLQFFQLVGSKSSPVDMEISFFLNQ
jgi:hypothetical protein